MKSYELWLSFRYLRAKRKQTAISVVTLLSVVGVGVGVMALIVVISVMTGFAEDLKEKILGVTAHVMVLKRGQEMKDYEEVAQKLRAIPGVKGVSPFIIREVILQGPHRATGAVVRGLDPESAGSVLPLERILKFGHIEDLNMPSGAEVPGIILGKELAQYVGAGVGDPVVLVSPLGTLTPWGNLPKWKKFTVKGFFDSGYWEFDYKLAYISLSVAQKVFDIPGQVTGIELRVNDVYRTGEIRKLIYQSSLGPDYVAEDWMQRNRNLLFALGMEKKVMFVILFCIVGVAALLIISILVMMVMEKQKDIAILKTMGANSAQILRIFMFQGLIIGMLGTLLGCTGGLLISLNLEKIVGWLERTLGVQFLPGDVYYISELPSRVDAVDVAIIVGVTLLISLGASLYPSWRAAKLDPVEGLRYE
jgi:lipoprotein-releasing system permease protein